MRVALADDSALFREGLALVLGAADIEVASQARTGDELIHRVASDRPDAVILDIRMPPTFTDEGLVTAERLNESMPTVGILVLSTYAETALAVRLLQAKRGGVGYLLKDRVEDVRTLRDALSRIVAGESVVDPDIVVRLLRRQRAAGEMARLSAREQTVMGLLAEGRSNAGIAERLCVSPKTVEGYVARIFVKLDLHDMPADNRRVLAVLSWLRRHDAPTGIDFA